MKNELINLYPTITKGCSINKIGQPFTYYYADDIQSNILVSDCYEYDIKSAFPYIAKFLLGKDHQFVKNIFKINDKLERNIFISTTLTQENKRGNNFLTINDLNIWSKIIILGTVYSKFDNINILEYKKDGILISAIDKKKPDQNHNRFLEIINSNFEIHKQKVILYSRFNKTSLIRYVNQITIKGKYKNPPQYIYECINQFLNGNIYEDTLLNEIYTIYSNKNFLRLCLHLNMKDKIETHFQFQNKRFLNRSGELDNNLQNICHVSYLTYILYPILSLLRMNKNNI